VSARRWILANSRADHHFSHTSAGDPTAAADEVVELTLANPDNEKPAFSESGADVLMDDGS
jgi:hypothetical protein